MDKNDFIKLLFERAKAAGFSDCEAYVASGEEFSVNIFKGDILMYNSAASEGLGFRGLYNGRMGISSTQVYDEESVDQLVEGALESARLSENDDEEFLCDGKGEYLQISAYDEKLAGVAAAEKIALARELEQAAYARDERVVKTEASEVFYDLSACRIVNTRGLDVSYRTNIVGMAVAPVVTENDKPSVAFRFTFGRDFDALRAKKDQIAGDAVREALDFLAAESVPSGEYRIVLRHDAADSLLATFSEVFSAESAQKGLSLLKGREGDTIAAPCVTIVDDPNGPCPRPFDGEGVATRRKNVVDKGVLTTLLHNLKTAHKQGVASTGNAERSGYGGAVHVAPVCMYVQPGEKSLDQLLADMGDGLMITDLEGLHAGANQVSGDFSLSAKGYLVQDGKIARAVEQITVAGNFFTLLQQVTEVGSDLEFGMSPRFGCPSLAVKGLAVAGK